ncbi:hypothetical protein PMAYCL1PPCAC_02008, partial [Pristionchus mayeri]
LLVETVSDGGGSGLVDDSDNVEAGNGTSVLGGLSLGVVEIGGDSDDGVLHFLSEVRLSDLLHLDQHHGGHFLGSELLLVLADVHLHVRLVRLVGHLEGPQLDVVLHSLVVVLSSDESLRVEDRVLGVDRQLVLRCISNQSLSSGSEGHVRGGDSVSLVVGDDL